MVAATPDSRVGSALHGFTFPGRYCYDKPSAERAWERLFALFDRRLRSD